MVIHSKQSKQFWIEENPQVEYTYLSGEWKKTKMCLPYVKGLSEGMCMSIWRVRLNGKTTLKYPDEIEEEP